MVCSGSRPILLYTVWNPVYLLLVWHAPLGVRSAKRRHQSPEWTILSHSYRLIQWEVVWSQVLLDSLHPRGSRTSWWSPPVLWRVSSYDTPGICLVWHSCNMAEQRKTPCLDNSRQAWLPGCLNSSFRTWWYHLIPNNFCKHHWSRTSILSTSLLVTAQHSEPYRKIGRMQMSYNFSLVGMVILDLQICLSRFCIVARVMALRLEISGELWVDE